MKIRLFTIAAALHFFALPAHASVKAPTPEKAKAIVKEIAITDDTRRLLVPTKVEARVASLVTAEVEGFVTSIKKPLGSEVKAGQTILFLENKDPAFTYAKVPVRAPVSGVVSQMNATLMAKVSRGDKLFVVMDPKSLRLSAEISGSELSGISPGSKGVFKENIGDQEGIAIRVSGISPYVDPRTGTASAELEFVDGKGKNLPAVGMVGHALFESSRGKVILIPEAALGYLDGKPNVKVVDSTGAVKRKTIELGEQRESQLVVKSGLSAGEKIVVRSSRTLKDGETVDVEAGKF